MGHDTAVTDLRKLFKRELFEIPTADYIEQLRSESDRSAIVLLAGYIESHLAAELKDRMPTLNSDEMTRIFDFNGPLGSFSAKIFMAQAMGIIDRPLRRKLDLIREMRNVAAHAHVSVNFETPEIRTAALEHFDPDLRKLFEIFGKDSVRRGFQYICAYYVMVISGAPTPNPKQFMADVLRKHLPEMRALLDKWQPPLSEDRTGPDQKD